MVSFVTFLLLGIVAGLCAAALIPENNRLTLGPTLALGAAGGACGGLMSGLWQSEALRRVDTTEAAVSFLGASIVIALGAMIFREPGSDTIIDS